jgi:hypothetical protein
MSRSMVYLVNHKTRMRQILSGPPNGEDHIANIKQAIKDGFVEVTANEQDAFGEQTQILIKAGWNKSPRTLKNFSHLLVTP